MPYKLAAKLSIRAACFRRSPSLRATAMTSSPPWLTAAFVTLVVAVALLFPLGVRTASRRLGVAVFPSTWLAAAIIVVVLSVPCALAASGALLGFSRGIPPVLRVIAATTVVTISIAISPLGTRLASGLPLSTLVGYQSYRIGVELILVGLERYAVIPARMTAAGSNFDIVTGLTAPIIAWLLARGTVGTRIALVWNVIGLGLLANVVITALLSMPTAARVFHDRIAFTLPTRAPFIWLPTLLAQAGLLGHILVFRALGRRSANRTG